VGRELAGQVTVGKVDIDRNPRIAERYGVRSIPTLVLFEGGREVDRRTVFAGRDELRRWAQARSVVAAGERC
jgi:thioredoxin-like negative regulator of GroEL